MMNRRWISDMGIISSRIIISSGNKVSPLIITRYPQC